MVVSQWLDSGTAIGSSNSAVNPGKLKAGSCRDECARVHRRTEPQQQQVPTDDEWTGDIHMYYVFLSLRKEGSSDTCYHGWSLRTLWLVKWASYEKTACYCSHEVSEDVRDRKGGSPGIAEEWRAGNCSVGCGVAALYKAESSEDRCTLVNVHDRLGQ